MLKFLMGRKGRMTQMFTDEGACVPVTIVEAGPCFVTKILTQDSDGYEAVQLGFSEAREVTLSKPELGHLNKAGTALLRHLREVRVDATPEGIEVGAELKADVFEVGEKVDVIGTSKGRGWGGVMKRHNFAGGRMTHGGMARRRPGSLSMSAYPGKVFKGKKMAGRFGGERVTTKSLTVMGVDTERNLLILKGAVPGHRGGMIQIRRTIKG